MLRLPWWCAYSASRIHNSIVITTTSTSSSSSSASIIISSAIVGIVDDGAHDELDHDPHEDAHLLPVRDVAVPYAQQRHEAEEGAEEQAEHQVPASADVVIATITTTSSSSSSSSAGTGSDVP